MKIKTLFRRILPMTLAVSMAFSVQAFANTETNPEPQGTLSSDIKLGDTNNDGNITADDALCALKLVAGILPTQTLSTTAGDLDKNGKINVRDAYNILRSVAGLDDSISLGTDNLEEIEYYVPEMYKEGSTFLSEKAVGFYGADGYGKYTTGGRGGRIIEVTNLNDSGPGSFRAACEASGPRIIVFKVSGTIVTKTGIRIKNGDVTIAGETAPGDGICITANAFSSQADNVIIRHMTFRTGDALNAWGLYTGGEWGVDALTVSGQNVIIDHCTASWGTDETLSVVLRGDGLTPETTTDNISIQWSMISESLVFSSNTGMRLGLGSLVCGSSGSKYSFHHNIYACHASRLPDLANSHESRDIYGNEMYGDFNFEFYNNVVYNWQGSSAGKDAAYDEEGIYLRTVNSDWVSNYYIPGPDSSGCHAYSEAVYGNTFYAKGNMYEGVLKEDLQDLVVFESDVQATDKNPYYARNKEFYYDYDHADGFVRENPLETSIMSNVQTADQAMIDVLNYAGHSLSRDTLDIGLTEGIRNKTAKCINYPYESAGWAAEQPEKNNGKAYADWLVANMPSRAQYDAYVDTDKDGMSDAWEDFMGLDKNNAADGAASYLGTEYTNLDVFLQFLIENPDAAIAR